MDRSIYRYKLSPKISMIDAWNSLFLSILASESIYGRAEVRTGLRFYLDDEEHTCYFDARSDVGQHTLKVFTGLITEQFGNDSYSIDHTEPENGFESRPQHQGSNK